MIEIFVLQCELNTLKETLNKFVSKFSINRISIEADRIDKKVEQYKKELEDVLLGIESTKKDMNIFEEKFNIKAVYERIEEIQDEISSFSIKTNEALKKVKKKKSYETKQYVHNNA